MLNIDSSQEPRCPYRGVQLNLQGFRSQCSFRPLLQKGKCILHDTDPGKDKAQFARVLQEKLERDLSDNDINVLDLSGIWFPSWGATYRRTSWAATYIKKFPKSVSFRNAHFLGEANFRDAAFLGYADFWGAEFHRWADFTGAKFPTGASFRDDQFHDEFGFFPRAEYQTRFEFQTEASFVNAEFQGEANFGGAKFQGEADFWDAEFHISHDVSFARSVVNGRLTFQATQFPSEDRAGQEGLSNGIGRVNFSNIDVKPQGEIIFDTTDLTRASFLRTNLDRFRFRSITWPRRRTRIWGITLPEYISKGQFVLLDHLELEQGSNPEANSSLVADLYRQLRVKLESSRQEIEAGDFYIHQMDLRQRDDGFSVVYRALLRLYRLVSLYGESFILPLVIYFIPNAILFALLYLLVGFYGIEDGNRTRIRYVFGLDLPSLEHFMQGYAYALIAGGLIRESINFILPWGPLIRALNAFVDLFLIGVALVALRRRFHR